MKHIAKRSMALLLTVLMLVGVAIPVVCAVQVADAVETTPQSSAVSDSESESVTEGKLLYTADFKNSNFEFISNDNSAYTEYVSESGNTVKLTGSGDAYFGARTDLPLADNVYTITYTVSRETAGVTQGFYVDRNGENVAANGFGGTDTTVFFYKEGATTYANCDTAFNSFGIVPFAEGSSIADVGLLLSYSDLITHQYKILVDGIGGSMTYYVLTDIIAERWEKIMQVELETVGSSLKDTCLNVILRASSTESSEVTFSDVKVYSGGLITVNKYGKLLLELEDMSKPQTGNYGVTYTPNVHQHDKGNTRAMQYGYDEKKGVHSMSAPGYGTSYQTTTVYGGDTNLRMGAGQKYTIVFKQMMHRHYQDDRYGGDFGFAFSTMSRDVNSLSAVAMQQRYGDVALARFNASGGESPSSYIGYGSDVTSYKYSCVGEYVTITIEIDGEDVIVYRDGIKVHDTYNTSGWNDLYGSLGLALFDRTGGIGAFTVKGRTHMTYRDIKVYSGLIMSECTPVVVYNSTEYVCTAGNEEYTLPEANDKEGYVFKGWRIDTTESGSSIAAPGVTISIDGVEKITAVYKKAKLDMSDIRAQFNKDRTEIRIISVVSKEAISGTIGYKVVFDDDDTKRDDVVMKKVYTKLSANYGTSEITVDSIGYHKNTQGYLTSFVIDNLPNNKEVTLQLTPYGGDFTDKAPNITIVIDAANGTVRALNNGEYSIISFNLNKSDTGDTGDGEFPCQTERINYVVGLTDQGNVDILGVQECAIHWYESLNAALVEPEDAKYAVAGGEVREPDNPDGQKWRNAIYYRKDKFDCLNAGGTTKWLTDTPYKPSNCSPNDPNVYGRQYCTMTYAVLRDKMTGEVFVYVNTHLGFGNEDRPKQDNVLLEQSAIVGDKYDCPVLISGDFNDGDYKLLTGEPAQGFYDRYYNGGFSTSFSFIPGVSNTSADQIFVDSDTVVVTYHTRLGWESKDKIMSDHNPVVAKFYLNNN